LIESATGQTVHEGRVRYHADNVTVRVPFQRPRRGTPAPSLPRTPSHR
jgi:CRISPR-associated protein Cas1